MRKSKKKLLIGIIAIIIIITIIGLILIKNIINSKGIEQANYAANGNSDSKLIAGYIKKGVTIGGIEGTLEFLDTSDATATERDIISGKTAYVNGNKVTGNYVPLDTSDATATKSDILSGKTAYVNGNKVTGEYEPLNTSDATATAENISSGKTAYVNGVKITGNGTDVNNSYNNGYNTGYNNGYNAAKASNSLTNGGTTGFGDNNDDPDSSSNVGYNQLSIGVESNRYVIITVTLRYKNYDSSGVTVWSASGLNVISSNSNGGYSKWAGTFGQAYVFFGYTTSNTVVLQSSHAYRWAGTISYINIQ